MRVPNRRRPIQSKSNVEPYGMEWVWRRALLFVVGMAARACVYGGRGDALLRWRRAWRWASRRATVLVAGCGDVWVLKALAQGEELRVHWSPRHVARGERKSHITWTSQARVKLGMHPQRNK